jgi:hypothetical protein
MRYAAHARRVQRWLCRDCGYRFSETNLSYSNATQHASRIDTRAFADDEYVCRIADNIDQAKQLIESGFDYVTNIDEHKLFRKRR